jgi:vacuolar iron transporter family protein
MAFASARRRLRVSLVRSAGTIVFGMEDGTVSIFGLIFGVAATTDSTATIVIAGATGAVAAAVSMMAGVYLDAETTRDAQAASKAAALQSDASSLPGELAAAGLTEEQSAALTKAVAHDASAIRGLLLALRHSPDAPESPWTQALWMLVADFAAAAVPILPFVWLPVAQARVLSGTVTFLLLVGLGVGRARVAKRDTVRTVVETVAIGIAAALAGVVIGILVNRGFGG